MKRTTVKGNRPGTRGQGDLLSKLVDRPQDEKAGANASLGFTYQHWWAVLKATELHAAGKDYAIGLEVKEDVIVLDSSVTPSAVWFYQVKKHEQSGVWALTDLLKQSPKKEGKTLSTLAKLYSRRHALTEHASKLCFVSNVGFKVPLTGTDELQFSVKCALTEFGDKHIAELRTKIAKQLELDAKKIDLSDFNLERTHLPLGEQETFITGKLTILNGEGHLQFKISKPLIAAQILASEIRQRANSNDFANSVEKLLKRCLTRTEITQLFIKAEAAGPSAQTVLEEGIKTLEQEGFPWGAREKIDREKVRICASLSDRTNVQFQQLLVAFDECFNEHEIELSASETLSSALMSLTTVVTAKYARLVAGAGEGYLRGIAILVLKNGHKADKFPFEASAQPEVGP